MVRFYLLLSFNLISELSSMEIDAIFVHIILLKLNTENEQFFLPFKIIIVRLVDQFILLVQIYCL